MEYLLLQFFKNKPEVVHTYYKYRPLLMNVMLLIAICAAILSGNDKVRSLSLGVAAGITLVNVGESVSRLRGNSNKDYIQSESVNG